MALERRQIKGPAATVIDNCWIPGNPFETHFLNTYTLFIPEGEKFIIRTSKKFLGKVSEELSKDAKALFYQEGQHSAQHAKLIKLLEDKGYTIKPVLDVANAFAYGFLERFEPDLQLLSVCSGIEHINACIAEYFLQRNPPFEGAAPDIAKIFAWHFAEEIEHGCVVYDILQEVDSSYALRVLGLFSAYLQFVPALYGGAAVLAFQDRSLFGKEFWQGMFGFTFGNSFTKATVAAFRHYLRPSFHPSQSLNMPLVQKGIDFYKVCQARLESSPANGASAHAASS